jgi:hypothetical protein
VTRIDIVRRGRYWVATSKQLHKLPFRSLFKRRVVAMVAAAARKSLEPISVRIHLANGRIEEERTYPHAADPSRSPG